MPVIAWRFTDGRPGHDAQSLGLVRALRERVGLSVFDLPAHPGGSGYWSWLTGRYAAGERLPAPALLLGAGHATHGHLLAARRRWGGRAVVLMKPSLPLSCFDLCLIPEHDSPPRRANVLVTQGVLNRVRPGGEHRPDRALIVLGGPSRHYRWDNEQMLAQVRELIAARPHRSWQLTTSRRTPDTLAAALDGLAGVECRRFEANAGGGWLESALASAGEVWVSEDSVSMIYEALASGARVGLLKVQRHRPNRVTAGVDALVEKGWLGEPGQWQLQVLPEKPLDEATRCAEWITRTWLETP